LTEHQNSAQPAVPAKTPEQIYKNRIQKMNDRQLLRESKRLQKAHAGKFPRINGFLRHLWRKHKLREQMTIEFKEPKK
jgi:hypothetical protein